MEYLPDGCVTARNIVIQNGVHSATHGTAHIGIDTIAYHHTFITRHSGSLQRVMEYPGMRLLHTRRFRIGYRMEIMRDVRILQLISLYRAKSVGDDVQPIIPP